MLILVNPIDRTPDGWAQMDENFAAIMAFVNSLDAKVFAASGDGADLVVDLFDRPGIVGVHSYWLDVDAYEGGSEILCGRRPSPNLLIGETDVSAAFGTFGGEKQRVQQPGDVTLDAAAFLTDLPKTIYVGVGSSGTAQLFEDQSTSDVLYIYSMLWDGFGLSEFKRLGHYLPAYSLLQALAKRSRELSVFDPETQWTGDLLAEVRLPLHGKASANGVDGLEESHEIVGGYVDIPKGGPGRFYCPAGSSSTLKLKFMLNGEKLNLGDLEIDVANAPDRIYFTVDADTIGSDRFVVEPEEVTIERVSIGDDVVSARGCTYGLFLRPVLGVPIPKDSDAVDQI